MQNECKIIVSGAGILSHEQDARNAKDTSVIPNEHRVYAATSTHSAAKIVKENDFVPLKSGWRRGIPPTLLNEGSIVGMDVMVLMVNTIIDVPDFRASALISNAVTKLVLGLHCDIASLMVDAQIIENKMKQVRNGHNGSMIIYK
jgi:predicted ATP-grasp superfamily ATP-dependent carboligase